MHNEEGLCFETCCLPYPKEQATEVLSPEEIERINKQLMDEYGRHLEAGEMEDSNAQG